MPLTKHKNEESRPHPSREKSSVDNEAETVVLPRRVSSVTSHVQPFFDRTYMANEEEIKQATQFETQDYRVAYLRWTVWLTISLVLTDAVTMAIASFFISSCYGFEFAFIDHAGRVFLLSTWQMVVVFIAIWIISLWISGCYQRHLMGEGFDLYAKIVTSAFAAVLIVGVICLAGRVQLPRWQIMWVILLATFLTCIERWGWRRIVHDLRMHGHLLYPVTLVGTWGGVIKAIDDIASNAGLGYRAIAVAPIVSDGGAIKVDPSIQENKKHFSLWAQKNNLHILSFNSHLPATARALGSQVVLLTDGIQRGSRDYAAFSLAVEASGMELSIPVTTTGDVNSGTMFFLHNASDTMPVLTSSLPQFHWFRQATKRIFDLILAVIALVVSLIPMLIISLAIKHDDGGPVIYSQKRIGQYGKVFRMYKFRSMRVGADKEEQKLAHDMHQEGKTTFKAKDDPRVTHIGRFLRRTSLDELPQIFNILEGKMSFVGPRPQLPYQRDYDNAVYATRLLVKPGLTGLWQVSGRATLSEEQGEQLDVWYVSNNSFAGDVAILLKTIPAVLRGTGAY